MPQLYRPEQRRRRTASSASSSSTSSTSIGSIRPTDADDSIVLSDLLRTGEASRLRRRGAMRIEHGAITGSSSHPYNSVRPPSPTMLITDSTSWDSDYDPDSQTVLEGHLYRNTSSHFPRIRPRPSRRHGLHDTVAYTQLRDQPDEYVYTLVCGTKITNPSLDNEEIEPFKPSILPLYPPLASSSNDKIQDKNTGCGTIVHIRAAPRSRVGMWSARSVAPSSVITLDASYFDTREAAKLIRNSCGCVKEGVGCAVCGNPLGIRYVPCKAASDSFFLPCNSRKLHSPDPSNRPRGPEGPQYWQAPSSQSSTDDRAIHTFFSHSVTSIPPYEFPPSKSSTTTRQRAYSDASVDLVVEEDEESSPQTVTQAFPSGDFYTDVEEVGGLARWDRLRESDMVGFIPPPPEEGEGEQEVTDVPTPPEMILDRFSTSSPVPFSEPGDENASATINRGSWGFPSAYLRHHTRSVLTPVPVRSINDANNQQYDQESFESFYQQQVLGAWERERERGDEARRNTDDVRNVSVLDTNWWGASSTSDPDGESEVWGVVDWATAGGSAADPYDSESGDKSTEGGLFPGR